VWVASGGLAPALAERLAGPSTLPIALQTARSLTCPPAEGPVLVLVGSRSDAAREQVRGLAEAGVLVRELPLGAIMANDSAAASGAARVLEALHRGEDVGVTIGVGEPEAEREAVRNAAGLASRVGALLVSAAGTVGGLVLTGGDTAVGLLRAWGAEGLDLIGEVEPGMPLSLAIRVRRIPVITKAGAFGHRRSLVVARDRLRGPQRGESRLGVCRAP
jgi:4-hydroxythreonine-4-phosphate dehydrogenase